jgi:hypothetical protein
MISWQKKLFIEPKSKNCICCVISSEKKNEYNLFHWHLRVAPTPLLKLSAKGVFPKKIGAFVRFVPIFSLWYLTWVFGSEGECTALQNIPKWPHEASHHPGIWTDHMHRWGGLDHRSELPQVHLEWCPNLPSHIFLITQQCQSKAWYNNFMDISCTETLCKNISSNINWHHLFCRAIIMRWSQDI